jgi:excisionase family DNA binding protein
MGPPGPPLPSRHRSWRAAGRPSRAGGAGAAASWRLADRPRWRAAAWLVPAGRLPGWGSLGKHGRLGRHGARRSPRASGGRRSVQRGHRTIAPPGRRPTFRRTGPTNPSPSVSSRSGRAEMSRYLTVEEVAEALGVSASWVYKHQDLLGGVRLGKRLWRFPEQELAELLGEPARGSPRSRVEGAMANGNPRGESRRSPPWPRSAPAPPAAAHQTAGGGQEARDLLQAAQHLRPAPRRQAPRRPTHPTGLSGPQIIPGAARPRTGRR